MCGCLNSAKQHAVKRIQGFVNFTEIGEQHVVARCQRAKRGIAPHQIKNFAETILPIDMPQDCRAKSAGMKLSLSAKLLPANTPSDSSHGSVTNLPLTGSDGKMK